MMPVSLGPTNSQSTEVQLPRSIAREIRLRDDSVIANVSHELRNPLTSLRMRLSLARMQPEKMGDHLATMESLIDTMCMLIEDLLDTSRLELGKLQLKKQRVVMQNLISRAVELHDPQARQKHVLLEGTVPERPIEAFLDPLRMNQVLTNLVANAINYTPEGGTITVHLAEQNDQLVIQICDTGIGIPAHLLSHVFEPFFRVEHSLRNGTGLGLTISKEIIEAHGGTIIVESTIGQGSVFSIKLPRQMATN